MKQRFQGKKVDNNKYGKRLICSVCVFAGILVLFFAGTGYFSSQTKAREKENLENALARSIVFCYTVEGVYPENVEYLRDNYGLRYDEDAYLVDYHLVGENIMPDFEVIDREAE